jgi:hypothetical protein
MRADSNIYTLATSASSTGSAVPVLGGSYVFMAEGTASGATISLQLQAPDGTWSDVAAVGGSNVVKSTTLPYAATPVYLPQCSVRMAVAGGPPSGVNATLAGIG